MSYQYFTVISPDPIFRKNKYNTKRHILCRCNACGREVEMYEWYLKTGKYKSCGCRRIRSGKENHSWKGVGDLSHEQFGAIKHGAKQRGIPWNLTIDELWKKFEEQKGKCALTGDILNFNRDRRKREYGNASLDRIDSFGPYSYENTRWVVKEVNLMKNVLSDEKLLHYAKKLVDFNYDQISDSLLSK